MKGQWLLLVTVLLVLAAFGGTAPTSAQSNETFVICEGRISATLNGGIATQTGIATHPRIAIYKLSDNNTAVFVVWEEDVTWKENKNDKPKPLNREILLQRLVFKPNDACKVEEKGITLAPLEIYGEKDNPDNLANVSKSWDSGVSAAPDVGLTSRETGLVVWQDSIQNEENHWDVPVIFLRRFTVKTDTKEIKFDDALSLSDSIPGVAWGAENPSIVIDGVGGSYVAWTQETADRRKEIYFRSSAPFAPKVNVSRGLTGVAGAPHAAMDTSKVYVVWQGTSEELPGIEPEIFISQANDPGRSFIKPVFSAPKNISGPDSSGSSVDPAIAVEKQRGQPIGPQVVVWSDNSPRDDNPNGNSHIFFRRSTEAFYPPFNVSANCTSAAPGGNSYHPAIAVVDSSNLASKDDNIAIVWQQENKTKTNSDIFFARSNFRPLDPFTCINLTGSKDRQARYPAVAIDHAGTAYIVWQGKDDSKSNASAIYLTVVYKKP